MNSNSNLLIASDRLLIGNADFLIGMFLIVRPNSSGGVR